MSDSNKMKAMFEGRHVHFSDKKGAQMFVDKLNELDLGMCAEVVMSWDRELTYRVNTSDFRGPRSFNSHEWLKEQGFEVSDA